MKKRLLSMILAISMVLTFLPVSAFATDEDGYFSEGDFTYGIIGKIVGTPGMEDKCSVVGYSGSSADVVIPAEVEHNGETYQVTVIGSAFAGRDDVTSVIIPNGVTLIGEDAFEDCTNLKYVKIPSSATTISDNAFYGCENLNNVVLPSGLTSIQAETFQECYGLTDITISEGVQSIEEGALAYCTSLTEITIPGSVTSIGDLAFTYCPALRKVHLSETVPSMGEYAFGQCETDDEYVKIYYPGSKDDWVDATHHVTIEGLQANQTELRYEAFRDRPASVHSIPICYNIDVNFNANGGTFSDGNETYAESVSRTDNLTKEQLPKAVKKGYELVGWCTDPADAENTSFDPMNIEPSDENPFGGVYDDMPTLYAVWEKIPDQKLTVTSGTFTYKDGDKEVTGTTGVIPVGTSVTVTFDKDAFVDSSLKFSYWNIEGLTQDEANKYNKRESFTFTMPAVGVTLEAMTQDDSIDDAVAEALGNTAIVGTAVLGGAALGVTGYMLGTEMYLICLLPIGTPIPTNTAQLAKLVWTDAGKPAPAALLAEDTTEEQQAMAWAVENDLIDADKAADASVSRIEVIKTWKKAQSVKKG